MLALLLLFGGTALIALLTDIDAVREASRPMLGFAAVYVAVSLAAFQLDGILIGLSATREMRNASFHSIVVYFAAWLLLAPAFGVAGLWAAMIIYVIARAAALGRYYPRLNKLISG